MAELRTHVGRLLLESPFVLASGPLSYSAEGLLRAHRAGAGAVVTKTIREEAARNPIPHIAKFPCGLLNAEKWSDEPPQYWIETGIPEAVAGGAKVIASLAMAPGMLRAFAREAAGAGAAALEVCSYEADEMVPMVEAAAGVDVPVLAKVSANWPNVRDIALACLGAGASGITATDSVGPALRFDLVRRAPVLASGFGWVTGPAILPFSLRVVAEIALARGTPIVGTGGVETADQAIEMLFAGAYAVGICSSPMVAGIDIFSRLRRDLSRRLDELGFGGVTEAVGAGLPALRRALDSGDLLCPDPSSVANEFFAWSQERCIDCGLCVRVCSYEARQSPQEIRPERCRLCGLCASICPTEALSMQPLDGDGPNSDREELP